MSICSCLFSNILAQKSYLYGWVGARLYESFHCHLTCNRIAKNGLKNKNQTQLASWDMIYSDVFSHFKGLFHVDHYYAMCKSTLYVARHRLLCRTSHACWNNFQLIDCSAHPFQGISMMPDIIFCGYQSLPQPIGNFPKLMQFSR